MYIYIYDIDSGATNFLGHVVSHCLPIPCMYRKPMCPITHALPKCGSCFQGICHQMAHGPLWGSLGKTGAGLVQQQELPALGQGTIQ